MKSTRLTVQSLLRTVAMANAALESDASVPVLRTAVRSIHRELKKFVEAEELWAELYRRGERAEDIDKPLPKDALSAISDIFSEEMASLLAQAGWKYPPKPSASKMIEKTRRALRAANTELSHVGRIEHARAGLREFLEKLLKHLPSSDPEVLRRLVRRGRSAGITSCLLIGLMPLNLGLSTGEEWDINVETSSGDGVKIELVVPAPWHEDKDAASGLVVAGAAECLSSVLTDVEDDASEPDQNRETRSEGQIRLVGFAEEDIVGDLPDQEQVRRREAEWRTQQTSGEQGNRSKDV